MHGQDREGGRAVGWCGSGNAELEAARPRAGAGHALPAHLTWTAASHHSSELSALLKGENSVPARWDCWET